ncbi:DUF1223 domain-containing protein [Thaumasiovibrio subtropicus]|uniref:DUF1223 domain-containing protein n=1 Tax=Thaumasiovibrio subtropicus TaxID=1891207 RepID=UPI000B35C012|nr:DUF1223 domain-containing protein [Thaumasiovibrio subtropicus]
MSLLSRNSVSRSLSVLLTLLPAAALAQTWTHQGQPAQLVELFTSEGCSSCPPADRYLSQFQQSPDLWQSIIPVAFHVDYWDRLGWKDEFAHPAYSQRQRLYRAYGDIGSVYTPGFVVDGKEWRGFFRRKALPNQFQKEGGTLTLSRDADQFTVLYDQQGKYTAHIVLLAMDEHTEVKAGENRGRDLEHDFVVLEKRQLNAEKQWRFVDIDVADNADAVAVWLTQGRESQPVQTVAGYFHP